MRQLIFLLVPGLMLSGCATFQAQYKGEPVKPLPAKEINSRFFLAGDAGYSPMDEFSTGLQVLNELVQHESGEKDYIFFLGDNVYPDGIPEKTDKTYELALHRLNAQIETGKKFKGKTIFIPGNHDWYADNGLQGLRRQEELVNEALGDESFLPEGGCPMYVKDLDDDIKLIILDTQWYLENWDRVPGINDECDIKTRDRLLLEVKDELKDGKQKTVLFFMHHPMYTNGIHGGRFALNKHLYPLSENKRYPLPIIGTLVAQVRTQGGVSIQDRYNERYDNLMKRLETLASDYENVLFLSGHEHSLQYIESENIKQVVSGSGSKTSYAALRHNGLFSYGLQGITVLHVFKDKSVWASFYGMEEGNSKLLYQKEVIKPDVMEYNVDSLSETFPRHVEASIYSDDETDVSQFHELLWGESYRDLYGAKVKARVATLDTLYGGLEIVGEGGGHQTRSLNLKRKDGRELNMRALRKSPARFLQNAVFKEDYIKNDFDKTVIEDLIFDFYTAAHPYAFLAIPVLSDAADLYTTNPRLYYIPKHKFLGNYNQDFGNELYMIVERPEENYSEERTFGYADDIESTYDIIEKIHEDPKYKIDEPVYIRARLFDMLIGDWDRHHDQWRWAQFDLPDGDKLFRPIPRDRDQAFANFDGALLDVMRVISGSVNQLQVYDSELRDLEWLNKAGINLDRTLIRNSSRDVWLEQAKFLQTQITDEIIDKAFSRVPEAAQDKSLNEIKEKLKGRREILFDIADRYYSYLNQLVILAGTGKEDHITVERNGDATAIEIAGIIDGKKDEVFVSRIFDNDITKEVWVYGLENQDVFEVAGDDQGSLRVRLMGGLGNDVFNLSNGHNIKVYDHRSKENTITHRNGGRIKLTDIYEYNTYRFDKTISRKSNIQPNISYNPDDGINLAAGYISTVNGFEQNPYTARYEIQPRYFFATRSAELSFNSEFINLYGQWFLNLAGGITSNNYIRNFFGFGNETSDNAGHFDFHRVKMSNYNLNLGIVKHSEFGSDYYLRVVFDTYKVQNTPDRFIADYLQRAPSENLTRRNYYAGLNGKYTYLSIDDPQIPTHGMNFLLDIGTTYRFTDNVALFGYVNSKLGFYNALTLNRKLVLKTNIYSQWRIGKGYYFYHAASAGGDNGLRGYRHSRFTGKTAFIASADIRYTLPLLKTRLFPLTPGLFVGYDTGRVWLKNDQSNTWHNDYGGGFWITAAEKLTGTFNLFKGSEGFRFTASLGVNF